MLSSKTNALLTHTLASFWRKQSCCCCRVCHRSAIRLARWWSKRKNTYAQKSASSDLFATRDIMRYFTVFAWWPAQMQLLWYPMILFKSLFHYWRLVVGRWNLHVIRVACHWDTCIVVHYGDVIMGAIASQIANLTIVYSTFYSDADQRKHQSSASLTFVRGIHRGPVNSPHKWPVTRKMYPFDDVIMPSNYYHADTTCWCS